MFLPQEAAASKGVINQHNMNKSLQISNPGYRIAIIGNAGGGKTTLSLKLGREFSLPVFHIDNLQWDKSWKRKSELIFQKAHNQLMNLDNWIIDGVGSETELYKRLYQANIIIFIDLSVKEHLRLAKEREKTPTKTAPRGCSYESMFNTVAKIINQLNATLIPQLRADIPEIAKITGSTVYNINQIEDMTCLHNKLKSVIRKNHAN